MTLGADHLRTTVKPARRARRILSWENGRGALRSVSTEGLSDEEYVAALHRMADEFDYEGVCYFIGGEGGPVKIGCTTDVDRRLRDLRQSSPVPLKLLASTHGGQSRETAYHFVFGAHRLHGEWFERTPELEAEIARLNAQGQHERVRV
jgi:hypothetical protein